MINNMSESNQLISEQLRETNALLAAILTAICTDSDQALTTIKALETYRQRKKDNGDKEDEEHEWFGF